MTLGKRSLESGELELQARRGSTELEAIALDDSSASALAEILAGLT